MLETLLYSNNTFIRTPKNLVMDSLTFEELKQRSLTLIQEFKKHGKREWGPEACVIELQKQLGELAKLVMSAEGYYIKQRDNIDKYAVDKEKLADEMSDILFILIRLADHYGIDLEKEHLKQIKLAYEWFETHTELLQFSA